MDLSKSAAIEYAAIEYNEKNIWNDVYKEGALIQSQEFTFSHVSSSAFYYNGFFASKSTMNFLGIPSMSLGDVNCEEEGVVAEMKETKDSYKKILHKDGRIVGAVLQGDLAYSGILQQLIARKIDVSRVKKPLFDIDYSDFFHMKENFEFYYD